MIKNLEIILKLSERCNLYCTYCYFFNRGDQSYKDNPPVISQFTIESLILFIKNACVQYPLKKVIFDFHGGEPLLMKKPIFIECVLEYNPN